MKWRWSATCSQQVSKTSVRTSSMSMARLWLTCSWRQRTPRLCALCWNAAQPASPPSSQVGNDKAVVLQKWASSPTMTSLLRTRALVLCWCRLFSSIWGNYPSVDLMFNFFLLSFSEICRWFLWYLQDGGSLCRQRTREECHDSWNWGFAGKSLSLPARVRQWSGKALVQEAGEKATVLVVGSCPCWCVGFA